MHNNTMISYQEISRIFRIRPGVSKDADLCTGFAFKTSLLGPSVARAREPKESIIKLTYSSWIDVKGDSSKTAEPKNAITSATTFTVS